MNWKKAKLNCSKRIKGFIIRDWIWIYQGSENNVNRIMDTDSIRDFRLRKEI